MPDLITHMAFTHIASRPFIWGTRSLSANACRILIYLGTLLPDILTRPFYILFPISNNWVTPIHTPFGMFIVTFIIILFFENKIRWQSYLFLNLGVLLHFLLDATQKKIIGNNYWFFPFSLKDLHWEWLWADEYVSYIPLTIMIVMTFETIFQYLQRKIKNRPKSKLD